MIWQKMTHLMENRNLLVKKELVEQKQQLQKLRNQLEEKQNELRKNIEMCRSMEKEFLNKTAPIILSQTLKDHKTHVKYIAAQKEAIEKKIQQAENQVQTKFDELTKTRIRAQTIFRKLEKYKHLLSDNQKKNLIISLKQEESRMEEASAIRGRATSLEFHGF